MQAWSNAIPSFSARRFDSESKRRKLLFKAHLPRQLSFAVVNQIFRTRPIYFPADVKPTLLPSRRRPPLLTMSLSTFCEKASGPYPDAGSSCRAENLPMGCDNSFSRSFFISSRHGGLICGIIFPAKAPGVDKQFLKPGPASPAAQASICRRQCKYTTIASERRVL
jgi:hypothetical protein